MIRQSFQNEARVLVLVTAGLALLALALASLVPSWLGR